MNYSSLQADIIFEEDKGFYDSIRIIGLEAKKPVIITCQSTQFLKTLGLEYTHVEITPYVHVSLLSFSSQICTGDSFNVKSFVNC